MQETSETFLGLLLKFKKGQNRLELLLAFLIASFAISYSLFQMLTAYFGPIDLYLQRFLTLNVFLILGLLLDLSKRLNQKSTYQIANLVDVILLCSLISATIFIVVDYDHFVFRTGKPTNLDLLVGIIIVISTFELTRRIIGWPMIIVALFFVAQNLFGSYFPGFLRAPSISWDKIMQVLFMENYGLYSIPVGVLASYLILFTIFAALLEKTGGSDFFRDVAFALTGRLTGGAAQAAVVASALFGTISGSSIANVMTTGVFTIPMMKKRGYRPEFAGAVEAVASTGGQIMPPLMGTSAFLIAEFLGISYWNVVKAAIIPALLYFFSIFMMIYFESKKFQLPPLPEEDIPSLRNVLKKRGLLLVPFIALIMLIALGYSVMKAGIIAIILLIVVSFFRKDTRIDSIDFLQALEKGTTNAITVALACGSAGIIVGSVWVSGIGDIVSKLILDLSGGNPLAVLVLTAIAGIIFGMGLPTPAVYVTLAMIIIPAIVELGFSVLGAHLFAFFFGIVSGITPPVALTTFAASSLSGSKPLKTGFVGFKIAIVSFLLPFAFIYNPELILEGAVASIFLAILSAILGTVFLAIGVQGWLFSKITWERIFFVMGAVLLIFPGINTDVVGLLIVCPFILINLWNTRKKVFIDYKG